MDRANAQSISHYLQYKATTYREWWMLHNCSTKWKTREGNTKAGIGYAHSTRLVVTSGPTKAGRCLGQDLDQAHGYAESSERPKGVSIALLKVEKLSTHQDMHSGKDFFSSLCLTGSIGFPKTFEGWEGGWMG